MPKLLKVHVAKHLSAKKENAKKVINVGDSTLDVPPKIIAYNKIGTSRTLSPTYALKIYIIYDILLSE